MVYAKKDETRATRRTSTAERGASEGDPQGLEGDGFQGSRQRKQHVGQVSGYYTMS